MKTNKILINVINYLTILFMLAAPCLVMAMSNEAIDDAKITLQVKTKLVAEKDIPSGKISVETRDGVVYLKGVLSSENQANTAIEVAESVEGIKDVDTTNLKVEGSNAPLADTYITAKVKGLFLKRKVFGDQPIAAVDVKVETKNGVVYLSGEVDNSTLERNAIEIAKEVKGVRNVVSTIKIKG